MISNVIITTYHGAENCLKNLSELCCDSDNQPEFFHQLSYISHNLQVVLNLRIQNVVSKGLADLISIQRNLKHLKLNYRNERRDNVTDNISSLMKISNSIIKISTKCLYVDFKNLQFIIFSKLQILKIQYACSEFELLIKLLETNRKTLKKIFIGKIWEKFMIIH